MVERPGVVDEDVHAAQLVRDGRDCRIDLPPVGDVALQRKRVSSEGADLVDRRLGVDDPLRPRSLCEDAVPVGIAALVGLELDVRDRDVGARAREREGVRAAEPARSARDERDASRKVDLDSHARP